MEVHHHSHTERKKWNHYVWEFLMLFLAVFCGFLAENQREHLIEHKREKEYIRSMVEDLRLDTVEFAIESNDREAAIIMFDSLIILLKKEQRTPFEQQRIYYLARMSIRLSTFPLLNNKAYEQMKSSGNLRLIHNEEIANKITKYYFSSNDISLNVMQTLPRLQSLIEAQGKVLDGTVFHEMTDQKTFLIRPPSGNPLLLTADKQAINDVIVRSHYVMSILMYSRNYMRQLKQENLQLSGILKKEYHLK